MVLIGLIIIIAVLIVLAVPRIWRKLSMPAAGREARSRAATEQKR
jgi:competence protein ComGC